MTTEHLKLLKSLQGGTKYLHMGSTPVKALALALQWEDEGLININYGLGGLMTLTTKGEELLTTLKPQI